jgi:hypothetical protein
MHLDALPDPAGRCRVVRGVHFDAAIEMDRPQPIAVIAKRFDRQRLQRGSFLGKHGGDLTLRRAVDPCVGPVRVPAIEIGLALLERLETHPAERRLLRVADAGFDLALAIRITDATRQADEPIVREHVAIERIERRLVNVRREDALFQIVEDDDPGRATQPSKRALMQLRPRLRARGPRQQPNGFARIPERQDEEPGPPIRGAWRGPYHRPLAVVDLRFLTRCRGDDHARIGRRVGAEPPHEAPDARVAAGKAVVVHEVLPDRHRIAAAAERLDDQIAVRLARAGARRATWWRPRRRRRVGGHLRGNGRFWFPFSWTAPSADGDTRRPEIGPGRLASNTGLLLNPPERPSEASERQDLLLFDQVQDVPHATEEYMSSSPSTSRLRRQLMAGFEVSINGRFWVSTEARGQ